MASVGFQGADAQQAMADQIRQRIADALSQQQATHTMGLQDAELKLRQDEAAQNAQDRALLRQQQGQTFNAKIGDETAANYGPGRTVLSPEQAASLTKLNPALSPLMSQDQTLPSTQFAGGAAAPDVSPQLANRFVSGTLRPLTDQANAAPSTPTAVTQQAPQATGNVAFAGLPKVNDAEQLKTLYGQLADTPGLNPVQKIGVKIGAAGGTVAPGLLEQKGNPALDQARIQALTDNARNAAERIRVEGDSAAARAAAAQANAELARARLDFAQQQAGAKAETWAPTGDTAIDPAGNPSFVFRNGKGEIKYVAAPPGLKIEKPAPGGGIGDWWRSMFGASDASTPKRIVYGTDGKPIS